MNELKKQLQDTYARASVNTPIDEITLILDEYDSIEKNLEAIVLIKTLLKGKITFDKKSIIIRFNKRDNYQVRIPLRRTHLKLLKEVFGDANHI